jgi:hypothetical protein
MVKDEPESEPEQAWRRGEKRGSLVWREITMRKPPLLGSRRQGQGPIIASLPAQSWHRPIQRQEASQLPSLDFKISESIAVPTDFKSGILVWNLVCSVRKRTKSNLLKFLCLRFQLKCIVDSGESEVFGTFNLANESKFFATSAQSIQAPSLVNYRRLFSKFRRKDR